MSHNHRWMAIVAIMAGSSLGAACQRTPEAAAAIKPAHVEAITGTELSRVTLSARAAERLDIQTAPVGVMQVSGLPRKVVPYGAVLYDAHGDTWVYTNPDPLVFVRHRIQVDYITGDRAVLSEGPPAGTVVVTVGAVELFGAEFEVGH